MCVCCVVVVLGEVSVLAGYLRVMFFRRCVCENVLCIYSHPPPSTPPPNTHTHTQTHAQEDKEDKEEDKEEKKDE